MRINKFKNFWKETFGPEIKDEIEGERHYQNLAEKHPEHSEDFKEMAADEKKHHDKLVEMEGETKKTITPTVQEVKTIARNKIKEAKGLSSLIEEVYNELDKKGYRSTSEEDTNIREIVNEVWNEVHKDIRSYGQHFQSGSILGLGKTEELDTNYSMIGPDENHKEKDEKKNLKYLEDEYTSVKAAFEHEKKKGNTKEADRLEDELDDLVDQINQYNKNMENNIEKDLVSDIMEYEDGNLSDDEVIKLFQRLVDSGQAWSLQGHYGRTAQALIDQGLVKLKNNKKKSQIEKTSKKGSDIIVGDQINTDSGWDKVVKIYEEKNGRDLRTSMGYSARIGNDEMIEVKKSQVQKTRTIDEIKRDLTATQNALFQVGPYDKLKKEELRNQLDRLQGELDDKMKEEKAREDIAMKKRIDDIRSIKPLTFNKYWKIINKYASDDIIGTYASSVILFFGEDKLRDETNLERVSDWLNGKGLNAQDAQKAIDLALSMIKENPIEENELVSKATDREILDNPERAYNRGESVSHIREVLEDAGVDDREIDEVIAEFYDENVDD